MDYNKVRQKETVKKTISSLTERNIKASLVSTGEEALAMIKSLIPAGASVMTGASTTLDQIGFTDLLKSSGHAWNNLKEAVAAEKDPAIQMRLRREATLADYFLGSVHAVAEDGQLIIASNSGSQLPSYAYTSPNVIFVAGTQKIVPSLEEGLKRLEEYVIPLEDARMKSVGMGGTKLNKLLIFKGEPTYTGRNIRMIFVNEPLGF